MSQYFTDFREYVAKDWSSKGYLKYGFNASNIWDDGYWYDVETIDVDGGTGTEGDQYLRVTRGIDNYSVLAWEQVGLVSGTMEVLAKVRFVGTLSNSINVGVAICVGGAAGSEDGYFAYIDGYGTPGCQLMKRDGGAQTFHGKITSPAPASGTWYWIRIKRDATNVYVSFWQDGSVEPGSWGITFADTTFTSGYIGLGFQDNKDHYCDVFSVGTGGDVPIEDSTGVPGPAAPTLTVTVDGDRALLQNSAWPQTEYAQESVEWEVALSTDPTFATPVFDTGEEDNPTFFPGVWTGDDLSAATAYLARARWSNPYSTSSWSVVQSFTTGAAATEFYCDFSAYEDDAVPFDWYLLEDANIIALYDYCIKEIYGDTETYHGFQVKADTSRFGDRYLRRAQLDVCASEEFSTDAQTALGNVDYWTFLWTKPGDFSDGQIYARIYGRHSVGFVFRTNYCFWLQFATTTNVFKLSELASGSVSDVGGASYNWPNRQGNLWETDWYNVRIQFVGTAIKGKLWRVGDIEPDDWQIEITDATYSSGFVGVSCTDTNRLIPLFIDAFNVEVSATPSGAWPPSGSDAPTIPSAPTIGDISVDAYGNTSVACSSFIGDSDAVHLNTRWQVDLQTGDFSNPIVDTQYELDHLESITFPTLKGGDYKVRALHRDNFENESSWSTAKNFSVSSRQAPEEVAAYGWQGDIWCLDDFKGQTYYGLTTGSSSSSGPGGGGGATNVKYHDDQMGRYCYRYLISGSSYQSVTKETYGVDLLMLLDPDRNALPFVYSIQDLARADIPTYYRNAQTNPERSGFVGVHLGSEMNRSSSTNSGHEDLAIGFRTHNGGNWQAYMTNYNGAGVGSLLKEVDTGIGEDEVLWWEIQIDAWNKQVRWYVDGELVTTYDVQSGDVDDFGQGGRVGGVYVNSGAFYMHWNAAPIMMPHRIVQEASV